MKSTYVVINDGKVFTYKVAGSAERAIDLVAEKNGFDVKYMRAVEFVSASDLDVELACLESIDFEVA